MKTRTEQYLVELQTNDLTGDIERETWFDRQTQNVHRPNGPADIKFYEWEGRRCRSETHYKQGVIYRADDLPSRVVVDVESGIETLRRWSEDSVTTRSGGKPALVKIDLETGVVVREEYWENGVQHRDNGPAHIERNRLTGEIVRQSYYVRGEKVVGPEIAEPDPP